MRAIRLRPAVVLLCVASVAAATAALVAAPSARASAHDLVDVPLWAVTPGTQLLYQTQEADAQGAPLGQGRELWSIVAVEGHVVHLTLETEGTLSPPAGEYRVDASSRRVLSSPEGWADGHAFWLWLPAVHEGERVDLWDGPFKVVKVDDGIVELRAEGPLGISEPFYSAEHRFYGGELFTRPDGSTLVVGIQAFTPGKAEGSALATTILFSGIMVVEFGMFFVFYRRHKKRLEADLAAHGAEPSGASPAVARSFCVGCGAPSSSTKCRVCGRVAGGAAS